MKVILTMFNKFYFLHIPKTGGRFFKSNVIVPILPYLGDNRVTVYDSSVSSHYNWDINFIDDETYIVSIFRDPSACTVSAFAHTTSLDDNGNKIFPEAGPDLLNRERFMMWVKNNEQYICNFQSKSFLVDSPEKSHMVHEYFTFDISEQQKEIIFQRVSRTNLLIKHADFSDSFCHRTQNKILTDFSITANLSKGNIDTNPNFTNQHSLDIFNSLTDSDIDYLKKINSVDYEIYLNDRNFYKDE